jgi:hypothetical protein
LNTNIHISRFKGGAKDTTPLEGTLAWAKVFKHLTTVRLAGNGKLSTPAISFAEYGPVKKRKNENVKQLWALCYDIDNRVPGSGSPGKPIDKPLFPEDLYLNGPLSDYAHLFYSTYHSTPQWPRFRLVILVDRPVTPGEYAHLYHEVAAHLGLGESMDAHADASRIFFEFHTPNTQDAFSGGKEHGAPLPVDSLLAEEAPLTEEPLIKDSASDFEAFVRNRGDNDLDKIEACLTVLDPDCPRDEWLRTGMGVHHETQGSDEGFALWHKWSEGGLISYAGVEDCQIRWDSFSQDKGAPTTLASVVNQVRKVDSGWMYTPPALEDFSPNTLRFKFFEPNYLEVEPPPITWLVDGLLNAYVPTMLTGVGNAGKSFLMMELALCLAHQIPFYGYKIPHPHTVFYLNGEDSKNKFKRRVLSWNEVRPQGLDLIPSRLSYHGPEHHSPRLTRKTLNHYVEAINRCNPISPVLIIDPLRRFAPGNIKEDEDASNYRALTFELGHRINGTVIDVHHETKVKNIEQASESRQGGHVGLGSTALFDLARQAFTLRLANADEAMSMGLSDVSDTVVRMGYVVLEHAKADEGEIGRNIYLRRGCGGVLNQIDVAEVAMNRVESAKGFYPVGVVEDEARAEFISKVRRMPPRIRDLRDQATVRKRFMGERWGDRERMSDWLAYAEMAGFIEVKKRGGLVVL